MRWLPEQHGWERLRVETIVQNGVASSRLCQVEPIPVADRWFERVWKEYTRHVQNRKEATEE